MAEMAQQRSDVFVVRMWLEHSVGVESSKRGYVEHVASGRRRYFTNLIDALEFVSAIGAMPLTAPGTGRPIFPPQFDIDS